MGIVYMLSWNGLAYVGSTIGTMKNRMVKHHYDFKRWLNGIGTNCGSYNIIKNEGYEILIIEEVENETKDECKEREQFWMDFYSEIGKLENHNNAYGLDKENKKNIDIKFFENNPNYLKEYWEKNKEKTNKRRRELYHLKKLSLLNVNTNGK